MTRDAAFEQVEVVANSHGECQQLLEPLLWFLELDRDAAWFEAHPGGEVLKILIDDGGRRLDQQLGLSYPLLPQLFNEVCHFAPTLDLVRAFVAFGDPLESGDQSVPVGESVDADAAIENARRHDLLGASSADAEQELDGGPVYIRKRVTT